MKGRKVAPHLYHVMAGRGPAIALDARAKPGRDD